eukprot:8395703-Ditylum_brightwellii.AAC.1
MFEIRQVADRFRELQKMHADQALNVSDGHSDDSNESEHPSCQPIFDSLYERKPDVAHIISDVKNMSVYRAIIGQKCLTENLHHDWLESLLQFEVWDQFTDKMIMALAEVLDNRVSWSQHPNRSICYHNKQLEMQQMLVAKLANN